jgi:hypothetical protein
VTTLSATTRAEARHNLPMRYLVCCDEAVGDGSIAICLPHKYDKNRCIVILFILQGDITWRGVQRWYGSTSINPKLLPVGGLHASTSGYVDLTSGLQNIGGDALQSIMARRMDPAMKVNETAPSNQVKGPNLPGGGRSPEIVASAKTSECPLPIESRPDLNSPRPDRALKIRAE